MEKKSDQFLFRVKKLFFSFKPNQSAFKTFFWFGKKMEQVIHSALHKNGAASRLRPKYLVFKKDHSLQIQKTPCTVIQNKDTTLFQ